MARTSFVESEKQRVNASLKSRVPMTSQYNAKTWGVIYEMADTGVQFVDMTRIFKILDLIDDDQYSYIQLIDDTVRLDNLAHAVYGKPELWWAIRIANFDDSELTSPFSVVSSGKQLKIIPIDILMDALKQIS